MPYGPLIHIEKEKCVAHITKRIESGLREKHSEGIIFQKYFHKLPLSSF